MGIVGLAVGIVGLDVGKKIGLVATTVGSAVGFCCGVGAVFGMWR